MKKFSLIVIVYILVAGIFPSGINPLLLYKPYSDWADPFPFWPHVFLLVSAFILGIIAMNLPEERI